MLSLALKSLMIGLAALLVLAPVSARAADPEADAQRVRALAAEAAARKAQIQAAETDAMDSLRRDVESTRLVVDMTVGDFLDQSKRIEALDDIMKGATQIGGARWIDDHSCIIRFELEGRRVGKKLIEVASGLGNKSPLPLPIVIKEVEPWSRRTFSATGTSTAAKYIVDVRPADANPAWRQVPEADSREAVSAARSDAIRRVFESLRGISLAEGSDKTVADALAVPAVRDDLQGWLGRQPVVGLEFGDDLEVRMTIAASSDDVWGVFRRSLSAQKEVPTPSTDDGWEKLRGEVITRVARAAGRSYVAVKKPSTQQSVAPGPLVLPDRPPDWVYDTIDAEGTATGPARSLKTARLAEDDAAKKLREQIYTFSLSRGVTISDAAKKDPRVDEAVTRSLLRARTYRVNWRDDGVAVRMTFDPRELWDELRDGH